MAMANTPSLKASSRVVGMPRGYRQSRRRQRGGRLRQLRQQLALSPGAMACCRCVW